MTLPPGWRPQPPEVRPGVIPLRPITVGELLGAVFATMRLHWRPLLAISSTVAAVSVVLLIPAIVAAQPVVRAYFALLTMDSGQSSAEVDATSTAALHAFWGFVPWLLLIVAVQFIAAVVIDSGTALVVSRAVLGKQTTASAALSAIGRSLPKLIGLGLIIGVSVTAGFFLCIIPGLILATLWFAAPIAMRVEPATIGGSLRRSWTLVGHSFWRVLGILLLVQVLVGVAVQVITTPVSFIGSVGIVTGQSGVDATNADVTSVLLVYLASGVLTLLMYSFASVARTLLYLDLRIRHENLAPALIEAAKSR